MLWQKIWQNDSIFGHIAQASVICVSEDFSKNIHKCNIFSGRCELYCFSDADITEPNFHKCNFFSGRCEFDCFSDADINQKAINVIFFQVDVNLIVSQMQILTKRP